MILSAWKDAGWDNPMLENKIDLDEVELVLPLHSSSREQSNTDSHSYSFFVKSLKSQDFRINVPDRFVKDFVKDFVKGYSQDALEKITERQWVILVIIASDSTISAKGISQKMSGKHSVTERTIQNDIAELKKIGVLTRKGGRKDGEWIINGKKA